MRSRAIREVDDIMKAFNSLFEMLAARELCKLAGQGVLSILYLRCSSHQYCYGFGPSVVELSILYLRCRPLERGGGKRD